MPPLDSILDLVGTLDDTLGGRPPCSGTRSAHSTASTEQMFLLTPVRYEPGKPTQEMIRELLEAGWYVFGEGTAGRKRLKPGDRIAIYESGVGVVAEAEVASRAERQPPEVDGLFQDLERRPWSFRVTNPRLFFDSRVVIDADLRSRLDAFKDCGPNRHWGLLVQATRSVSEHDFALLTN